MATERSVNRRSSGSGFITTQPSIVSARKAAPAVHAEVYGAWLILGNADQVLKRCAPVIALSAHPGGPFIMEMHRVGHFLAFCETLNFSRAAETCPAGFDSILLTCSTRRCPGRC